jgi:uncharacterized protein YjdB
MMKNGKRYLLVAIALLLATVLFSGLAMAEEPAQKAITKITPEKTSYEVKLEGSAYWSTDVPFTVEPADATQGVVASSSDEKIATVQVRDNDSIRVYSKKPGKVTVTIEAIDADNKKTGVKATFTVEFKEVDAEKIVFNEYSKRIALNSWDAEGELDDLFDVEVLPEKATYRYVTWTSSDPSILLTNEDGDYEIKKLGTVTVTATTTGAKKITQKATIEVYTEPITSVTFTPDKFEIEAFDRLDLSDYVKYGPDDGWRYPKQVLWTSSDTEIFGLYDYDYEYEEFWNTRYGLWGGQGHAGNKAGTATITVLVKNFDGSTATGTCTVTVKPVDLKGLSFTKSSLTLKENQEQIDLYDYLKWDPIDANIRYYDLCWESSNAQVVGVSDGLIYIKGAGSATISVYYKDNPAIEASIEVIVTNIGINNVQFDRKAMTLYFVAKPESKDDVVTYGYANFSVEPKDAFVKYTSVETSNAKVAVAGISFDNSSNTGTVSIQAVGKGKCKITVYVNDGKTNYTAQLKVTVTDKGVSAKLNKKNITLKVGKKATLFAKDSHNVKLAGTWSSSDKTIARVNKKGVVKGKNPGRCVITFTPKSKSIKPLSCQVKVVKPDN